LSQNKSDGIIVGIVKTPAKLKQVGLSLFRNYGSKQILSSQFCTVPLADNKRLFDVLQMNDE